MAPGVRRDHGLLPGRRQDDRVLRGHRPHASRRSRPSRRTSRRRACTACRAPGRSTTRRSSRLDLGTVAPSLAGPKRPQDRIEIGNVKKQFTSLFSKPPTENGFNQPAAQLLTRHLVRAADARSGEGDGAKIPHTPSAPPGAPRSVEEMAANKPTLAAALHEAEPAIPRARRHDGRQRRRADRRHHLLHQHLEPERAARRRPAGEEGGRGRPQGQAAHQDLARAGLAHRHRVPRPRPACCPTSRSSASTSPPTAAPPASATPAT